jgi:hypothetical protein
MMCTIRVGASARIYHDQRQLSGWFLLVVISLRR